MKTILHPENPFGVERYGFAWEQVPAQGTAHLDYGCGDGSFLIGLRGKDIPLLVGVDISREKIAEGRQKHPELDLRHLKENEFPALAENSFTSITLLDVLEHVPDQPGLLRHLLRLLAPEGILIVTVPGQYLFSFLDLGNLKFRFPGLHRWYFRRRMGVAEYDRRYHSNPDGLIGDISADKKWHEHFSPKKLAKILNAAGYEVTLRDGAGFFVRGLALLQIMYHWITKRESRLLARLVDADRGWFSSANLFMVARKSRTEA